MKLGNDKKSVLGALKSDPHEGWEDAFNAMADAKTCDGLVEGSLPNEFDQYEWVWQVSIEGS